MNVGLEDIFSRIIIIEQKQLQVTITVSVPNVSYSTGRITRYNQSTRLFTCLNTVLPQHQRKQYPFRDITQSDGTPRTSTGYSIVIHRSPFQIIQPIIQFECLSSGSP